MTRMLNGFHHRVGESSSVRFSGLRLTARFAARSEPLDFVRLEEPRAFYRSSGDNQLACIRCPPNAGR